MTERPLDEVALEYVLLLYHPDRQPAAPFSPEEWALHVELVSRVGEGQAGMHIAAAMDMYAMLVPTVPRGLLGKPCIPEGPHNE